MRCVVQRVKEASVTVDGEIVGKTGPGILALIGVSTEDTDKDYKYILDKVPNLRIFDDENGVMNRSLLDEGHSILAVSQFTLYGDARGGRRPSYIRAAAPDHPPGQRKGLLRGYRSSSLFNSDCASSATQLTTGT